MKVVSHFNTGIVTLSPVTLAPVCLVGDPLQITCTASVKFSFVVVNEQGMDEEITAFSNFRDSYLSVADTNINQFYHIHLQ